MGDLYTYKKIQFNAFEYTFCNKLMATPALNKGLHLDETILKSKKRNATILNIFETVIDIWKAIISFYYYSSTLLFYFYLSQKGNISFPLLNV